jgi:hypothetical protein
MNLPVSRDKVRQIGGRSTPAGKIASRQICIEKKWKDLKIPPSEKKREAGRTAPRTFSLIWAFRRKHESLWLIRHIALRTPFVPKPTGMTAVNSGEDRVLPGYGRG